MLLTAIRDFELANPLYAGATLSLYTTTAAGAITATLATLYDTPNGAATLQNPQTLDQFGKLAQPVYISAPVIGVITGLTVPSMTTGVIYTAPIFRFDQATSKLQYSYDGGTTWVDSGGWIFRNRGAWVTATLYNLLDIVTSGGVVYICVTQHTSAGAFAPANFQALFSLDQGTLPAGNTFQLRRGTTLLIDAMTPAAGEPIDDTTKKTIVIGDGATAGGFPMVQEQTYQGGTALYAVGTGTGDVIAATIVSKRTTLADGTNVRVLAPGANTLTTPTFNLTWQTAGGANTATGAITVTKDNNSALLAGDFAGAAHVLDLTYQNNKWRLNNPKIQVTVPAAQNVSFRQTVNNGVQDTNGRAAFLAAGAGLAMNLLATSAPLNMVFAQGFNGGAGADFPCFISADNNGAWTLPANNTSYLSLDYVTAASASPTQTLAPFQRSETYNQSRQSVLQFAGAAGATTFLDDFGNTWAAQGGAKVQTNQFKFGTGGLGGAGGSNVLNGTTDMVRSTVFTSLGGGSWSLRCWAYITSLAAVNVLIDATNAGAFGAQLLVTAAGKVAYNLSSTGAANDIAAAPVAGAATIVINGWHFYELTFDALAGVYRCYVDGTQDQSTASSAKICAITKVNVGGLNSSLTGTVGYIDKPEILPYCQRPNGTAYVSPVAAPSVIATGYASDWYDTVNSTMKSVSAASAAAGVNPTFTAVKRLYVGEGDSSGAAVTAARSYAFKGSFTAATTSTLAAAGSAISYNHNIGVDELEYGFDAICITADNNWQVNDRIQHSYGSGGNGNQENAMWATARSGGFTNNSAGSWGNYNKTTGAGFAMTAAQWKFRMWFRLKER